MRVITLSDSPGRKLARIEARLRPPRWVWLVAATPLVAGAVGFVAAPPGIGALLILIGLAGVGGVYLYGNLGGPERARLEAGRAGEEAVRRALAGLDDRYYLLNGLTLPMERMEIDHLLVGPRGLFVLETKSHGGAIVYAEGEWRRIEADASGMLRPRQIGNPSAQVERNTRLLRRYLAAQLGARAHGLPLVPVVVFTHPHATLDLGELPIAVAHLSRLHDVLRLYPEDRLSVSDAQHIVDVLTPPDGPERTEA